MGRPIVSLVPTTLQRLLDAGLREPPALRWALLGGAPATTALQGRAAAAGVPVAPTYGLTEACSQVTTLGAPLFCTRVRIAARRRDPRQRADGRGVGGIGRPVLATGDLGEWRPDGALRVAGRKADTIISGGENVAPAEVEAVLEAHPDVVEAAVHGRARPGAGARRSSPPSWPTPTLERRRAARVVRGAPGALQGAQGDRLRGGAAAHAVGQARAKGPAMSDETPTSERSRTGTDDGRRLEGDARQLPARDASRSRSGWSRRSTRSPATACSSSPPAWATPGCWPPSSSRPAAACSSPTASRTWSPPRASTPRRSAPRTSNYGACRPSGSTSRRRRWTPCICRFGYMLLLDPEAALRETRRVLKPGGRVALAVWDELERNPWMKVLREALVARGLAPAPVPDGPGPFALGSEEPSRELLATAGLRGHRGRRRWTSSCGAAEPRRLVGSRACRRR